MGKKQKKNKQTQTFEIFISGISYQSQEDDIRSFFDSDHIVQIKMPKYQDTGRCLGYAHVVFDDQQQYKKALSKDKQSLGNRYLDIKPAKGKKQLNVSNVSIPVGCKVLFIKNLPYTIQQEELRTQFSSCGIITDIRMVFNSVNKQFKGFTYIDYRDLGSVKKAINKYHGKLFKGRQLVLDAVTTSQKKGYKKRNLTYEEVQNQQQQN